MPRKQIVIGASALDAQMSGSEAGTPNRRVPVDNKLLTRAAEGHDSGGALLFGDFLFGQARESHPPSGGTIS